MQPNIGRLDAYCRISAGFTLLAYSTAKLIRKPNQGAPLHDGYDRRNEGGRRDYTLLSISVCRRT